MPVPETFCPLVSVITPTYEHKAFIGPCIESVLRQTYSNWEQIIIDDGSADDTGGVVARYADPRIRYVYQENQGPFELARTYNRALCLAKGELIAILEGDDFWPPDKLPALVPAFFDEEIVLAYGEAADVNPDGREQRKKSFSTRLRVRLPHSVLFNDPVGTATRYMLLAKGRSLVSPSTVLIRRRSLEGIGGFQYASALPLTDYPTFMELSLIGKFYYSRETMGYRRRHQESVTVRHTQAIHENVSRFTMRFLESHRDKIDLSPAQLREIEQSWREGEGMLHFSEGRLFLLRGKWAEARRQFWMVLKSKGFLVRMAALVGLLFSYVHLDIEPLMKLGGRADLRVQRNGEL
jgi:glycosyltransferase involved in cell wall biosynthesis